MAGAFTEDGGSGATIPACVLPTGSFRSSSCLGRGRVLTAQTLAERLEVSVRTIYRDIHDLAASGVPIEGEAGVGYCLRRGYQVPPLMFDQEELQALVFGADVAKARGDAEMAAGARARSDVHGDCCRIRNNSL